MAQSPLSSELGTLSVFLVWVVGAFLFSCYFIAVRMSMFVVDLQADWL